MASEKHPTRTWRYLKQRYCSAAWEIREAGIELLQPSRVKVERYRYRGTRILLPWMDPEELGDVGRYAQHDYDDLAHLGALQEAMLLSPRDRDLWRAGCAETCTSGSEGGCGETESGQPG
jgi:hypothetical protein